jgi:hypothetical protein
LSKRSATGKLFFLLIGAFFLFAVAMLMLAGGTWTLPALIWCGFLASLGLLAAFEDKSPALQRVGRAIGAITGLGAGLLSGALASLPPGKSLGLIALGVALGATYRHWLRFA